MRRLAIIGVTAVALAVAPAANAYHTLPGAPHWHGPSTVQANGGGCAQPCLWFRMIDRTGYGTNWQTTYWPSALNRIRAAFSAAGYSVQFTTVRGPRFWLWTCVGAYPPTCTSHHQEAMAETPPGAVFVGYNDSGTVSRNCDSSPPWPQPFCSLMFANHRVACVIGASSGAGNQDASDTMVHEMGHCLGLGHRRLDANYNCDGPSVMCALNYPKFDAHDKAEIASLYIHAH